MGGGTLLRPGDAGDAADARRGRSHAARPITAARLLPLVLLAGIAAGCATLAAGGDAPLEQTWRSGRLWLPERALAPGQPNGRRIAEVDGGRAPGPTPASIPLVIYVHGCAGLDEDAERWAQVLTSAGYAVVAPDSFARAGRRPRCDGRRPYPPDDRGVLALRESEIRYAVQQARTLPWVGEATIVLLGFDQGAVVVAGYGDGAVGAYILTGWTCTSPDVRQGLFTPLDQPVLAIRWADDPMFADAAWNGECGSHLGPRPGSRSIVLDGPGHSVVTDPGAREAVVQFLRAHTRR